MAEFLDFAGRQPWLAAFFALLACGAISLPFRLLNRYIRHLNIKHKGWPPEHLDGDGDFKPEPDEDDER